jgi:hypothetical protein
MKIKNFLTSSFMAILLGQLLSPSIFAQEGNDKKAENLPLYNLFYLSKYIPTNLEGHQADLVYNAVIASIGTEKANEERDKYQRASDKDRESNFLGAFLDDRTKNIEIKKQEITTNLRMGVFSIYSNTAVLQTKYKGYTEKHTQTEATIQNLQSLGKIMDPYIKLEKKSKDLLGIKKDSVTKEEIQIPLTNKIKELNINDSIAKAEYYEEVSSFVNKQKVFPTGSNNVASSFQSTDLKYSAMQIEINSIVQPAEQRAASSAFNLPSEADLINAMAMFLAKRAQQEAAIWFMDQLRENMNNPLIFEAFPETIKLIESLEDYKAPTFSISWRYAISSDFVKMPKNLAASSWVKSLIFDDNPDKAAIFSSCVNFSYELNRLVAEKYNYRDIIRYLYTNPDFDYEDNSVNREKNNPAQKSLSRSITILYILTNDFFSIDEIDNEKKFRLLSYEEINSLNENQLITLGQLIKAKYGSKFDNTTIFFQNQFITANKEKISKWLGNLLLSLSQFDKVNKDFQKALENKSEISNYNFYNIWQITSQIIDNVDYKNYSFSDPKNISSQNNFDISLIKNCVRIYDHMQSKNYAAGIKELTSIIEKISINKSTIGLYIKDIKVTFLTESISIVDKGVSKNIQLKLVDKNLEIYESSTPSYKFVIHNYSKIQPFIGFVNNLKKDYNYNVITKMDTDFDKKFSAFCDSLKLDKSSRTALLKIISFYDINNWNNSAKITLNQEKLVAYSKSSNSNQQIELTKDDIERAKNKYLNQLFKFTAFFSDILSAKNAEELSNVIDSHALPPTSYKLKRRVSSSLDLNGYVGLQGSRIWTNGNTSLKTQYTAGITAPIGFAYTWSTLKRAKPDNWGVTIDLVDLGNIVNHYLVNSTEEYSKDVHFSEVFSPAASFMYALRKTPFVVFASFKLLPLKTSSITNEDGSNKRLINEKAFDASVFSVGFKIDIPLVNLWSNVK